MKIGFYFENTIKLNAIPVPASLDYIDPATWHASNQGYCAKIGFNGLCSLYWWIKKFNPDNIISKKIGENPNDCDTNVFVITLSGNAAKYIYQNIFNFIKKETLEFLHKHNITIIIDYATERQHMWHRPKFSVEHCWDYVVPTMINNASALDITVPIKFLNAYSEETLNRIRQNYPIHDKFPVNFSFDSYQSFWLYLRYHLERRPELRYTPNLNNVSSNNKFMICLMGVAKSHRIGIMSKLIEYKLFPSNSYVSLFFDGYTKNNLEYETNRLPKDFFNTALVNFNENYTVDDFLTYNTLSHDDLTPPVDMLNDTYLNLATESWAGKVGSIPTEKTFKTFYWQKLPLIYGTKKIIHQLNDLGFEFLNIFDYTYDNMPGDEEESIKMFCRNLKFLSEFEKKDIKHLHEKNINLIEHNYNLFMNKKLFDLVEHLFI